MSAFITVALAALTHLWQTTLVLGGLWILAATLRRAPAVWQHRLWGLGLLKLVLPLGVLGALAARAVHAVAPAPGPGAAAALAPVRAVLDPVSRLDGLGANAAWAAAAFLLLWAVGAAVGLVRLARGLRAASGTASFPASRMSPASRARLGEALAGTVIPAERVRVSSTGTMPVVVGLRRPVILVPAEVVDGLSIAELRAVLLHEDAHRRRRDPLRLAAYRALAAFFFFHPLLGLLLDRLRETAEMACDEGALRAGAPPEELARGLARTVRLGLAPVRFAAAAESGNASLLGRRFERLYDPRRYALMTRHRLFLSAAAVLVAALSFAPLTGCSDRASVSETASAPASAPDQAAAIQPVPVKTPAPDYPEAARSAGLEGKVMVKIHIGPDGSVTSAMLAPDQDAPQVLADAALAAAREWRFQPLGDAAPGGTDAVIPFAFALNDKTK
jgi:bla regulator protein BlaR1